MLSYVHVLSSWACIYANKYVFIYIMYAYLRVYVRAHMHVINSNGQSPSWELTGPDLVQKFAAFYETRRFIAAFTTARHLSLSWARAIKCIIYNVADKTLFSLPHTFPCLASVSITRQLFLHCHKKPLNLRG
jgi:hypothetical protein